jgi:enoyl-CoA hydratase/3-hydroxyacyl-CoA dehydrogenase
MTAPVAEIDTICYIGAGTMGCVNSLVAAVSGYNVVLYDLSEETLAMVAERQQGFADHMVAIGYCTAEAVPAALARVRTTSDPADAAAGADLVSESVVEQVGVKRDAHALFDRLCGPSTILTTNTSSLLVSEIEGAVERGGRFAALHSHLGSPLYDIVGGPRTTPETIDVLRRFVVSLGGVPLVLRREYRGYIVNGLIGALTRTALQLLARGDATVAVVDRAWMLHRSAPIGPFGLLDLFGLDVVADNMGNATDSADQAARRSRVLPLLTDMVDAGNLGMKTGSGFYDYPDTAYGRPDFLDDSSGTEAIHRLLVGAVIHRAVLIAADGVAEPDDIDRAWQAAMGLDSGPFDVVRELGPDEFRQMSRELVASDLIAETDAERARDYVDRSALR